MGFWGEFLSELTLGVYTPRYRRINCFKAGERVSDVIPLLSTGLTMEQVKGMFLPALPFEPECTARVLVYKYAIQSANSITWYTLRLQFDFNGKLLWQN